jgi:hypothetical protein
MTKRQADGHEPSSDNVLEQIDSQPNGNSMETAELIQAAASIAGAMAATQYGKFGGMEASRITELATIAVKIARAIETEARKQP